MNSTVDLVRGAHSLRANRYISCHHCRYDVRIRQMGTKGIASQRNRGENPLHVYFPYCFALRYNKAGPGFRPFLHLWIAPKILI